MVQAPSRLPNQFISLVRCTVQRFLGIKIKKWFYPLTPSFSSVSGFTQPDKATQSIKNTPFAINISKKIHWKRKKTPFRTFFHVVKRVFLKKASYKNNLLPTKPVKLLVQWVKRRDFTIYYSLYSKMIVAEGGISKSSLSILFHCSCVPL